MATFVNTILVSAVVSAVFASVSSPYSNNNKSDDLEDKYFEQQLSESELFPCKLEKAVNNWCSLVPHGLWPSNKPSPRQSHATAIYSRTANQNETTAKMLLFGGQHLSTWSQGATTASCGILGYTVRKSLHGQNLIFLNCLQEDKGTV
eukprot:m.218583 g.218583  ORF g.218583 m.218583 type:complete len:148 (+) comp39900_c1_seq9:1155-1598(+)